jgi:hypothetical protein
MFTADFHLRFSGEEIATVLKTTAKHRANKDSNPMPIDEALRSECDSFVSQVNRTDSAIYQNLRHLPKKEEDCRA